MAAGPPGPHVRSCVRVPGSAGALVLPDTPVTGGAGLFVLGPPLGLPVAALVGDDVAAVVDRARHVRRVGAGPARGRGRRGRGRSGGGCGRGSGGRLGATAGLDRRRSAGQVAGEGVGGAGDLHRPVGGRGHRQVVVERQVDGGAGGQGLPGRELQGDPLEVALEAADVGAGVAAADDGRAEAGLVGGVVRGRGAVVELELGAAGQRGVRVVGDLQLRGERVVGVTQLELGELRPDVHGLGRQGGGARLLRAVGEADLNFWYIVSVSVSPISYWPLAAL